jgi:hypothetical protein
MRLRLPRHVHSRIFLNLITHAGIGAVPVAGDLFDFFSARTNAISISSNSTS